MPRDIAQDRVLPGASRSYVSGYFVLDTFTGVDATALPSHNPDVFPAGSVWAIGGPGPAATPNLSGNTMRIQDAGDGQTRWVEIDSLEADAIISLILRTNSINPTWGGIMFRQIGGTRWHFRTEQANGLLYLYDPTGANQSTAFAMSVSDVIEYTVAMVGSLVVCTAKNITSGLEKVISNNGGLNRLGTVHGITSRTVFGGGASDFYENFAVKVR